MSKRNYFNFVPVKLIKKVDMRMRLGILFFGLLFCVSMLSAQTDKSIRGLVVDNASGEVLPSVTITILDSNPLKGVVSDMDGNFRIENLPIGRYNIQASYVGYEPMIIREVLVSSGKETFLTIPLKENVTELQDIIVRPKVNKQEPLNNNALVSARMLSVEEASRYAGGFDDPARLVSSFAGVAGNISSNGIAIRGNSPQFLQWRMEGVEIPNPTHFADITGVGGGILTALSSQMLDNSDFFTGAFPAEYGNALSGVFDMQMRNGNRWDYEHTVQIGTLGVELSSEGPLKKGSHASYLFNYRYATMALADDLFPGLLGEASGMRYQDISFKLNFPTKQAGTFSVWGIGIIDRYKEDVESDSTKWEKTPDQMMAKYTQSMAAGGFGHKYYFNPNTYLKTALAGTATRNATVGDFTDWDGSVRDICDMEGTNWNLSLNSYLNRKFNAKHTNRTGIIINRLAYNLDYSISPSFPDKADPMERFAKSKGSTMYYSAFSQSAVRLTNELTLNLGLNLQYFQLNKNWSLEPRAAIKWQALPKHSFGLAYGKHTRHEKVDYYFVTTPESGDRPVNKDLDLSKAHHIVLSYDWNINGNTHLKVEPYFQYLYDIPVARDSSFSIINHQDWFLNIPLVNEGKGRNYGVDITLERYLSKGFYYLITTSLFESKYRGGDGVWRDTRLNRNYLINLLGGKEWLVGKNKQNVVSLNVRFSLQGGDRYTPPLEEASVTGEKVVYDEDNAFSKQLDPAFMTDFTISYTINRKKLAHGFALKMINLTGHKEFNGFFYNYRNRETEMYRSSVVMPNISYKIEF